LPARDRHDNFTLGRDRKAGRRQGSSAGGEPGLDQPIPAKSDTPDPVADDSAAAPDLAPGGISKPVGGAIPTPVKPGTDQPLPEKNADAD
jgi:hypothetical protein